MRYFKDWQSKFKIYDKALWSIILASRRNENIQKLPSLLAATAPRRSLRDSLNAFLSIHESSSKSNILPIYWPTNPHLPGKLLHVLIFISIHQKSKTTIQYKHQLQYCSTQQFGVEILWPNRVNISRNLLPLLSGSSLNYLALQSSCFNFSETSYIPKSKSHKHAWSQDFHDHMIHHHL